jgi:hypothetical protein
VESFIDNQPDPFGWRIQVCLVADAIIYVSDSDPVHVIFMCLNDLFVNRCSHRNGVAFLSEFSRDGLYVIA